MKAFKSLVVVNAPLAQVWTAVRDRLPELVVAMDDIEKVVAVERTDLGAGRFKLVNEWHAKMKVPEMLQSLLQAESIGWRDENVWDESRHVCEWTIEPWVLRQQIHCSGVTRYEPAIGGRGTRVTFEGTFELARSALAGVAGALALPLTPFIESIVTTLIPKNLRKVNEAAASQCQVRGKVAVASAN